MDQLLREKVGSSSPNVFRQMLNSHLLGMFNLDSCIEQMVGFDGLNIPFQLHNSRILQI